jgi:hypothetical protein
MIQLKHCIFKNKHSLQLQAQKSVCVFFMHMILSDFTCTGRYTHKHILFSAVKPVFLIILFENNPCLNTSIRSVTI